MPRSGRGANRAGFFPLYAVWNNGLKITPVGGEDSISNLQRSKLVGSVRTYVFTGDRGLDMQAWLDGMRAGHVFVSSGPLVELTVNKMRPGETVTLPTGGGTVEIEARVRSITPLETATLVFNGNVVEELPIGADRTRVDVRRTLRVTNSGWYHLRVEGSPADRFPLDAGFAQAFTNPVWVTVGEQQVRSRASAEYSIKWIDRLQEMAEAWPGWRSQEERVHVFAQFEEARQIYRQFVREAVPSNEAQP